MSERQELMRRIGSHAQKLRIKKGLTQEQMAEIIEISTPHYANIERGVKCPSALVLYRIAECLNVSADYLLYDHCTDAQVRRVATLLEGQPEKIVSKTEKLIEFWLELLADAGDN